MEKKLAIKPHVTRGEEVIKILESLGGVNADEHKGNLPIEWKSAYYIYGDNTIQFGRDEYLLKLNFVIFTLEEFLERFPYKVGDEFGYAYDKITEMFWDEEDEIVYYKTEYSRDYVTTTDIMLDSYARIK